MGVDVHHPKYDERAPQWNRMRDILGGSDAVKGRGEEYLPRPGGMDTTEWNGYKDRALFYNATARTLQGLAGAIFRKEPNTDWPEAEADLLKDVTGTGTDFNTFALNATGEVIGEGRCGIVVDAPKSGGSPYMRLYTAEAIINWRSVFVDGKERLVFVVLAEVEYRPSEKDPFELEKVNIRRVLMLDEAGHYAIQLWVHKAANGKAEWTLSETINPTITGQPLDFIPFIFIGPDNLDTSCAKPPLIDLAEVNLSHYRTSADLEHGAHFTALPTPWIAGRPANQDAVMRIGSGTAWLLGENSKAGMLEYAGQGLSALSDLLERKESLMAVLGARLLEQRRDAVESAETQKTRMAGESSVLATIAHTVGAGLAITLKWLAMWRGKKEREVTVELNTDFFGGTMSPTELAELVKAWQGGAIGPAVFYHNLRRGEMLPEDMTQDEFEEDAEKNAGALAALLGEGGTSTGTGAQPGTGTQDDA